MVPWRSETASLLLLLLLSALLVHPRTATAEPGEEGTCSSEDASCLADEKKTIPGPLVASVLLSDGVRLQLVRPHYMGISRSLSAMIRTQSPIMSTALAAGNDRKLIIAVVTFDGQATWFTSTRDVSGGGARAPLDSMGPVQQTGKKRFVSSLAMSHSGERTSLVLGHQDGKVSVWHHQDSGWVQVSVLRGSHHDWESVTRVTLSSDGRLLLGATGDNVALWRLPADIGTKELVNGQEDELPELRHLHGGGRELSATAMGTLADGRYLVVVAFTDGTMEGWGVSEDDEDDSPAEVLWKLRKSKVQRYVAAAASSSCVVAGDIDGQISLWKLNEDGGLVSEKPHWKVQPSSGEIPVGSLTMLSPLFAGHPERVAASVGNIMTVLDVATGEEVYGRAETGSPLEFLW